MLESEDTRWSGFLVVRLPSDNCDSNARYSLPAQPPRMDHIFYGGVDRMPWFDIDEAFYNGDLPPALKQLRQAIKDDNSDFSGIDLCKSLDIARQLLTYSNRDQPQNEIIVVRSAALTKIKGTVTVPKQDISQMGYDLVSLGNWSLLASGVFTRPDRFTKWKEYVNSFGLFSSSTDLLEYIAAYEAAAQAAAVEELPHSPYAIDVIEIGRVRTQAVDGQLPR